MPWVAAEFGANKQEVKQLHHVQGIPMLPIFSIGGDKISDNARGDVTQA